MRTNYIEITTKEDLQQVLTGYKGRFVKRFAFQNVNFEKVIVDETLLPKGFIDCIFLGCTLTRSVIERCDADCAVFSKLDVPFNVFRSELYSAMSLYSGYLPQDPDTFENCFDSRVYRHYLEKGKVTDNIKEQLARSIHDHSIKWAMQDFLERYPEKRVVGIMGGHGLLRTDEVYREVVLMSKKLTERGFLMVSGGGPGAMEATHLGAWMAGKCDECVDDAISILGEAPSFKDTEWLRTASAVIKKYPDPQYCSLGVPTWLYGHEPATPLATHIAKFFDNSMREDGILTVAKGGVIFTPGSAGTMQEIFQDAVQNHYLSFGYASPMIFWGSNFWLEELPVYRLLEHLVDKGRYKNLPLTLTDSVDEVVDILEKFSTE